MSERERRGEVSDLVRGLEARLPKTDSLRRARLQTHLFLMGYSTQESTKRDKESHWKRQIVSRQSNPTLEASSSNDMKLPITGKTYQNKTRNNLHKARAKSIETKRKASTSDVSENKIAVGKLLAKSDARSTDQSIKLLVIVVIVITMIGALAISWFGYSWYQSLTPVSDSDTQAPLDDLGFEPDDPTVENLSPKNEVGTVFEPEPETHTESNLAQESSLEPQSNPELETKFQTGSAENAVTSEADEMIASLPTPEEIEAAALEDAVLLLERQLSQDFLLDISAVDGAYDTETQAGLLEYARLFGLSEMENDINSAGLLPTRTQLEMWYTQF